MFQELSSRVWFCTSSRQQHSNEFKTATQQRVQDSNTATYSLKLFNFVDQFFNFKGMEPKKIDWNSVESIFVEDDTYERIDDLSTPDEPIDDLFAPVVKIDWVNLFTPDELIDDQAWFRNLGQTHLLHVRFPRKANGKRKL